MAGKELGESSEAMREQAVQARESLDKNSKVGCNSRMSPKQIKVHCQLDEAGEGMIQMAITEINLSAHVYDHILKVSRTIADLAGMSRCRRSMWPRLFSKGPWIGDVDLIVEAP